ncbi:MAG: hypothetical protein EOP06_24135 [Proteobacteria bacterium]|nr:MAG: hypothetical protein EOP06_24135 [Pseudomonadota bacterium]
MTSEEIRAVWKNYSGDMMLITRQSSSSEIAELHLRCYLNEWPDEILRAVAAAISSVIQEPKRIEDMRLLSNFHATHFTDRKEIIRTIIAHAFAIPTVFEFMKAG